MLPSFFAFFFPMYSGIRLVGLTSYYIVWLKISLVLRFSFSHAGRFYPPPFPQGKFFAPSGRFPLNLVTPDGLDLIQVVSCSFLPSSFPLFPNCILWAGDLPFLSPMWVPRPRHRCLFARRRLCVQKDIVPVDLESELVRKSNFCSYLPPYQTALLQLTFPPGVALRHPLGSLPFFFEILPRLIPRV